MSIGAAFVAMKDLDTADRIEVACTELAGVLFEGETDEMEARLASMVERIRKHYSALTECWAQERNEINRIAAAARTARDAGATLAVVAGSDVTTNDPPAATDED